MTGSYAMSSPVWEEQVPVAPWGVLRGYRTIPGERFESFSCGNDGLARVGGGRLALIDAKSEELASWYEHLGFTLLRGNPLRQAMKMGRIEQVLDGIADASK